MQKNIEYKGKIIESLSNGTFRVQTENNNIIFCYLSGKIRKNHIKIIKNDKVKIVVSKYDNSKGIIIFRI